MIEKALKKISPLLLNTLILFIILLIGLFVAVLFKIFFISDKPAVLFGQEFGTASIASIQDTASKAISSTYVHRYGISNLQCINKAEEILKELNYKTVKESAGVRGKQEDNIAYISCPSNNWENVIFNYVVAKNQSIAKNKTNHIFTQYLRH